MISIKDILYHIDVPNGEFQVERTSGINSDYYYAVYYHPTFGEVKTVRESDIGKTFFYTRQEVLDARVKRIERLLQCEKDCRDRKI